MKRTIKERLNKKQKQQTEAILASIKDTNKALAVSPTGTGKTTLITNVLKAEIKEGSKALILVHRVEQLNQVKDRIAQNCPNLTVSLFIGAHKELSGQVVVAMVQTIGRPQVLSKISNTLFTHILVDEVHHSPANSWDGVLTYFRDYKAIGFTATPTRPDGQGLTEKFGEPATQTLIKEAISDKIYAEPYATITLLASSIDGISGKNGDYTPAQLERLAVYDARNQAIVNTYLSKGRAKLAELGLTPKTICFCVNTLHAIRMRDAFRAKGVASEFIVSNSKYLDGIDRQMLFEQFRDTVETEVLCVVDLFNEAIDIPNASCVLMARPTRSAIIYTQQIGRASRYLDAKKETFVLLDFVDNTRIGFTAYNASALMPDRPKGSAGMIINMEYVAGIDDPIKLDERINALSVIDDFLSARAEFYPEAEQAYEACRKLGINGQKEYKAKYKEDLRLPSSPDTQYKDWSYKKIAGENRYYLKMLSLMPKNVKFKEGQKWKRTDDKYIFIDEDYGEFQSVPHKLMSQSWKTGLTGHPKRGTLSAANARTKGKIFCNETNEIYDSASKIAIKLDLNTSCVSEVLNGNRKQIKGYTFRYLTEQELEQYNKKKKAS